MLVKHVMIFCTASLLMLSCAREVSNQPASPSMQPIQSTEAIEKSGMFASGEHETVGMVRVTTENGKRFLELDQNFKTSTSGPDLFVILHRSDAVLKSTKPPSYPLKEQDYVVISRLRSYSGAQRYSIPDKIQLENYKSAVIWCRSFNATFGAAKLSS